MFDHTKREAYTGGCTPLLYFSDTSLNYFSELSEEELLEELLSELLLLSVEPEDFALLLELVVPEE